MNKSIIAAALAILLLASIAIAQEEEQDNDFFDITEIFESLRNAITSGLNSIPEKLFQFTRDIINAPLQPLLSFTNRLLSNPVDIAPFHSLWAIITYILSLFYGLFIIFAGFNLMISGYSASKRDQAKTWLRNSILLVIAVQSSYFIYTIILNLASSINQGTMGMIGPEFFLFTLDGPVNIGLDIALSIPYLLVLILTILLLAIRYLLVSAGIIFFPLGIFLSFIPPLKSYGKLILNVLLIFVFIPFVQILVLLVGSQLLGLAIFSNFKIIVMIASFLLADVVLILMVLVATIKSGAAIESSDIGQMIENGAKTARGASDGL